ncbi:MAG: peptidoglycan-binding protein [Chloroflexota bacterium]
MKPRALIAVATVVVAAGAVAYGAYSAGLIGAQATATATPSPERATATVTRQTLESVEELDGTLGFEGSGSIVNQLSGTVTRLYAAEGDILARGDRIIEVDGSVRSYVMYGSRPAWRTLQLDADLGADVKQLEENLQALGYLDKDVTPNAWFDEVTEAAVMAWQADRNVEDDGIVRLGEIVFLREPVRVTAVSANLGTRIGAGQTVATYSSTDRVVTVSLDANRQDLIAVGDPVMVELPDGTESPGSIADIASVATPAAQQGGRSQVAVTVRLDDPATSGSQDGAPVTVTIVRERREDVLTVPVSALLALAEGGYAVEVVGADGSVRLVAVTPGLFSGTVVEIRSDGVDEGSLVAVPS